jgi:hypothetical protein
MRQQVGGPMSRAEPVVVVGADAAAMSAAPQALRSAQAAGDRCEVIDRIRAKHVFAPLATHASRQGGVWGYSLVGGHRTFAGTATPQFSADVHSRGTASPARNQGG